MSKSKKDNTYKFALGKTLLEYARNTEPTGRTSVISYDYIAGEFLKHYWYQRYKYRLKQHFHVKKTPYVIQALEGVFGNNPPSDFVHLKQADKDAARKKIRENVFGLERKKKGVVIPRFQKIKDGNSTTYADLFYDHDDEQQKIFLKPEAHSFFKDNYNILSAALLSEWVRYLERVNYGLPMLTEKLDNLDAERGTLSKYKKDLLKHSDHCFYCNGGLSQNNSCGPHDSMVVHLY